MPAPKVFLIGTYHRYQMRGGFFSVTSSQWEEFIAMLRNVIFQNGLCSIAEELNKEDLKRHFCPDESSACQLADELGVEHRYCDPDTATRNKLSIPEGKEGHPKREQYWLEQLQSFNRFPGLFIMGADHFESFRDLLRQSGFEVVEVERDWVPSDYSEDDSEGVFMGD